MEASPLVTLHLPSGMVRDSSSTSSMAVSPPPTPMSVSPSTTSSPDSRPASPAPSVTSPNSSPTNSPPLSPKWTLQQAKEDIEAYVHFWSSNVSVREARGFIREGSQILLQIFKGALISPTHYPDGGTSRALNALSWSLTACALQKKQGHYDGSFAIEDVNNRLYQFLVRSKDVGTRWSTHYTDRSDVVFWDYVSVHQGVDVKNDKMPGNKTHLLFAQILPPQHVTRQTCGSLLFIKLEHYSPFWLSGPIPGSDRLWHTVGTVSSVWYKWMDPDKNDRDEMAKEHTPKALKTLFFNLVERINVEKMQTLKAQLKLQEFNDSPVEEVSRFGICYMRAFLKEARLLEALPVEYDSTQLEEQLSTFDHADKRKGREVYIGDQELHAHALSNSIAS